MAGKTVTGTTTKTKKPATKPVSKPGRHYLKEAGEGNRLALVRRLIDRLGDDLDKKVTKSGVAELIRLLSLEKEMGGGQEIVREIRVTWVEPTVTESSTSE